MFYISAYFRRKVLRWAVSRDDDWTGWCRFFLEGVRMQAEDNLAKARAILDLYEEMKIRVAELTRSHYAVHALDWIFERPIFRGIHFVKTAGIPEPTRAGCCVCFGKMKSYSVISIGGGRRSAILSFPALLNIAEGKKLF